MDGIQASILNVKLKYIEKWTVSRRNNANLYNELMSDITQITLPEEKLNNYHVWHLFVIKTKYRDKLKKFLKSKGIQSDIHYPISLPFYQLIRD